MSYTKPNVFVPGTVLTSADFEGNMEALRVYLHKGIAVGDIQNTPWIDTPAELDRGCGTPRWP